MGTIEGGVWKPWRHPDYRWAESEYQGWWRNCRTGDVIAILEVTEHPTSGRPLAQAGKYNFNARTRGSGFRLLVTTLERDYERLPDDLNPPNYA